MMSRRSKSRITVAGKAKRSTFEARMAPFIAGLPDDELLLIDLYDAYRIAGDAMVGIYNRPRVDELGNGLLDEEIDRANDRACAVAEKLKHLSFVSDRWRDEYVRTMMSHAIFCGANIDDMLSYLTAARRVPIKQAAEAA